MPLHRADLRDPDPERRKHVQKVQQVRDLRRMLRTSRLGEPYRGVWMHSTLLDLTPMSANLSRTGKSKTGGDIID